jgi:hypothetical protein
MDRELLHAGEDLHTGVHQAFIVVLPCFLNSASLVVWVSTRVGNRAMIGEELRNVLNAARAIFGLGKARLRQLLVETWGLLKTISRTVLEALVSIGMAFRYMSGSRHR